MRKIYVTGLGVISGIGQGVKENLDSLKSGKHGMGKITLFPTVLDVPVSEVKQSNEELKQILFLPSGKTYSRPALLGLLAARFRFSPYRTHFFHFHRRNGCKRAVLCLFPGG